MIDTDNAQFNGLRPAQAERLFYLLEELGEAQQAIGKILRHGYGSYDPTKVERVGEHKTPFLPPDNRTNLESELGDIARAIRMLTNAGDLRPDRIDAVAAKGPPLKYMHHQKSR
jgi:NTP pyrophosphatase (non-canonical NTP hydrolase)